MIIILDTNIVISALIRDSITRKILLLSGLNFYFPEISMHEIRKYKNVIIEKSGLTESEYEIILNEYAKLVKPPHPKGWGIHITDFRFG